MNITAFLKKIKNQEDKYLSRSFDTTTTVKDRIKFDGLNTKDKFEFTGDVTMMKLRQTMKKRRRSYEDELLKVFTELSILMKVNSDNPDLDNTKLMIKAHNINCGKMSFETEIAYRPNVDRSTYIYTQNENIYPLHKVGKTFMQHKVVSVALKGYYMVQVDSPNKIIDLSKKQMVIDFRECKRKDLSWSTDPQVRNMYFRILLLEPRTSSNPMVGEFSKGNLRREQRNSREHHRVCALQL